MPGNVLKVAISWPKVVVDCCVNGPFISAPDIHSLVFHIRNPPVFPSVMHRISYGGSYEAVRSLRKVCKVH